jgi:hypothetical protein
LVRAARWEPHMLGMAVSASASAWNALVRLDRAGLEREDLVRSAIDGLRRAVRFDAWCWSPADPATLLSACAMADNPALAGRQRRLFEIEYLEPDAVKHAALARGTAPVGALSQATGGDLSRSRRWAELLGPGGIGDELRAALMADGVCWGSLVRYRERRGGRFRAEDVETVGALLPILARLAPRLAVAPGGFDCPTDSPSPGLLVLGPDLTPLAASPPARRWLAAAGTGSALPGLVYALVARLWAVERGRRAPSHRGCALSPPPAAGSWSRPCAWTGRPSRAPSGS